MENNKEAILAPPSPYGPIYHQREEVGSIMHCAIGLRDPIDVEAIKSAFANSMITKHPMFTRVMIKDHRGRYRWQKPSHPINIDDHIIVHHHKGIAAIAQEKEEAVNAYLSDLSVSTPMSKEKPLWELHMLLGLDCLVWRVHHSVGDGASLFSMLLACFGKDSKCDPEKPKDGKSSADGNSSTGSGEKKTIWPRKKGRKSLWWTLKFSEKLGARLLWAKDKKTAISGGDGVEQWPRKIVTVKFKLGDFKALRKSIPNVTVNDVFLGLISSALSKYLRSIDNEARPRNCRITGMCAVNVRDVPTLQASELSQCSTFSGWGNKSGTVLVPMKLLRSKDELHPLENVKRIKSMMDRKKQSYEAHITYLSIPSTSNLFGLKVAAWLLKRYLLRTTFQCSNLMGPKEEVAIAGNPVTYIRGNASATPQAIAIYFVTYAERADVQIIVAKDIIQNPEFLAKCFEESFYEMLTANA
ncbi:hypothetical protein Droror1_Dr00002632 [Drosera rotundifolia]